MNAIPGLRFARTSRRRGGAGRLLVIDGDRIEHRRVLELPALFEPGDVLAVNDSATIPGSFQGDGFELRLLSSLSERAEDLSVWKAVLLGDGDWRTPTENRPAPPHVEAGQRLKLSGERLVARVEDVAEVSQRLVKIRFEGGDLWRRLYAAARPIQYSYLEEPLAVWDQQTLFAGPAVSVEPPSAAFPWSWETVFALKRKGVSVVALTHAAGISSTGDPAVDALLPLPERYWIPEATARALNEAHAAGRRIVALGTTVTRAIESGWNGERVRAGTGVAELKLGPSRRPRVVSGIFSGLHEPSASHVDLLSAFVDPRALFTGYLEAASRGYLWHEYGDSCLVYRR